MKRLFRSSQTLFALVPALVATLWLLSSSSQAVDNPKATKTRVEERLSEANRKIWKQLGAPLQITNEVEFLIDTKLNSRIQKADVRFMGVVKIYKDYLSVNAAKEISFANTAILDDIKEAMKTPKNCPNTIWDNAREDVMGSVLNNLTTGDTGPAQWNTYYSKLTLPKAKE